MLPTRRTTLATLLALPLAACAAGGPIMPEAAAPAPLHRVQWLPEGAPRAAMLALHGYGDHAASAFGGAAPFWAAAGIAVHAYDHRGFGHNPDRGQWPGTDRLIADAIAEAALLRERYPALPLYLLGHSMGGGIALAAMAEGASADGAILVAPAIAGGAAIGPFSRAGLWATTGLMPDRRWSGEGLVRFVASDNIDALRALAADPLYLGTPSLREITGLVRVMDRATAGAPSVTRPVLVLVGERDELVPPESMVEAAQAIPGLSKLVRYPEGWHLLLRDLQAATVWADIADWILEGQP